MPGPEMPDAAVGKVVDIRCSCGLPTQYLKSNFNPEAEEWYCPQCHISYSRSEYDPRANKFRRLAVVQHEEPTT